MTRTAVFPKLLDPNLAYQIYFFNFKSAIEFTKITKITYHIIKTGSKDQHIIKIRTIQILEPTKITLKPILVKILLIRISSLKLNHIHR